MRRQHPRGSASGNTTPSGEGDFTHEVPLGVGADVPGGWPVIPGEEPGGRWAEGKDDRGHAERVGERIAHGRRGGDRAGS